MKRAAQYLFNRNGVYHYRQIIPKHLRTFYTQREFRVSLHTKCPREARYRATKLTAEIIEQFNRIYMSNKDDTIQTGFMEAFSIVTGNKLGAYDTPEDRSIEERKHDEAIQKDLDYHNQNQNMPAQRDADIKNIAEARDEYLNSKKVNKHHKGNKTKQEYGYAIDLFLVLSGQTKFSEIDIKAAKSYYNQLKVLPKNFKSNSKPNKNKPIGVSNRNKLFGRMKAFLTWCVNNEYLMKNPFEAVDMERDDRNPNTLRDMFENEDLIAIFQSSYYLNNGWKDTVGKSQQSYRFWLFILGALTGARLAELCFLNVEDIHKDPNGEYFISINDDLDPITKQQVKSVKNDLSIRVIPVHSRLIEIGFIDFVESMKSGLLFKRQNSNKPKEPCRGCCSQVLNRILKDMGFIKSNYKVFHSFRHTFISNLGAQDIRQSIVSDMVGHSNKHSKMAGESQRSYFKGFSIQAQKDVIESLTYADILKELKWK